MAGHFDPNDYIENRKLKRLADFSKILCVASKNALTDAGISKDMEGYQPEKIGSIVNTVHGPMNVTFDYLDDLLTTGPATARLDCQHFFRQIFLGYFSDIVQAFDTLRKNVCGDDYTSLHNPIVLSSVLPAYGMFHSIQILFL